MKITFFCQECCNISSKEGGVTPEKGGRGAWKVNAIHMPIQNRYLYQFECEQMGHKNTILLDNLNYEVIFDSGLSALEDGYYAEAVSTIYASLEYFYKEMTIYMFRLINKDLCLEGLKHLFSKINNLSEKQVGMFHGIYFALMGENCRRFDTNFINKRNKVIHGSLYPSYNYAVELADLSKITSGKYITVSKQNFPTHALISTSPSYFTQVKLSITIQQFHDNRMHTFCPRTIR